MAGYKGHIVGGTIFAFGYIGVLIVLAVVDALNYQVGPLKGWQFIASLFIVAILFALWPDIDTNSKGQDIFYTIGFISDLFLIIRRHFEAAAILGLLGMTPIIGHHRGWTHSRIAMIVVPLPILIVPWLINTQYMQAALLFYGAAVMGYFSHLFLDGLIIKSFRIKSHEGWN